MSTLHILRSEPDEQTLELIQAVTPGEAKTILLSDQVVDYDALVVEIFGHDQIISWW